MSGPARADQPEIIDRPETPYIGVRRSITLRQMNQLAEPIPQIFAFLDERHISAAGPPFFRYHVVDMDNELDAEVGVPLSNPVGGDGEINPGILPAGRYVRITHVGHPDELIDVNRRLLAWAAEQQLEWDVDESGQRWGARLEVHHTDPVEQPDMNQWVTELVIRLAD